MIEIRRISWILLFLSGVIFPCQKTSAQCTSGLTQNTGPADEFILVWADEFSEDGPICSENWHHQTQLPNGSSWFNGEQQHYTDEITNSYVEDGLLKITARKEEYTDQGVTKDYTSARLNSKFAFTYGKVDVRAKLPTGKGTWPAIWTLGREISEVGGYWYDEYGTTGWPTIGEIDIMEHWGVDRQDLVNAATHTPSSFGGTVNKGSIRIDDVDDAFHVYSMIWDETKIRFFVDDINYYTYQPPLRDANTWPFDSPQYLLLNIAMGGIFSIDPNFESSTMEIDYVRVYQREQEPVNLPLTVASSPTQTEESVISLFSESYPSQPVDSWLAPTSQALLDDIEIEGEEVKKYSKAGRVVIQTESNPINASQMTHLHLDFWSDNTQLLRVGLFDYGPDGVPNSNPADESESDLFFGGANRGEWFSYDILLDNFNELTNTSNISKIILEGTPNGTTFYLDNLYFYRDANIAGPLAVNNDALNPTIRRIGGNLQIQFTKATKLVEFKVYNLSGRILRQGKGPVQTVSELRIPVDELGIQIVRVVTDRGVFTQKVSF